VCHPIADGDRLFEQLHVRRAAAILEGDVEGFARRAVRFVLQEGPDRRFVHRNRETAVGRRLQRRADKIGRQGLRLSGGYRNRGRVVAEVRAEGVLRADQLLRERHERAALRVR
jgi:hypothetical protein